MRRGVACIALASAAACSLGSDLDDLASGSVARDAGMEASGGTSGHAGASGNAGSAGAAGADGAAPDAPVVCEQGQTRCGGGCVDILADPGHCGGCDAVCTAPTGATAVCVAGRCDFVCGALTRCGASCVDDRGDPAHCGACGNACPGVAFGDPACVDGTCSAECDEGLDECGGRCVELASDPDHCGACDVTCDTGLVCGAATCTATCSGNLEACSGACVNLSTSVLHCGACGAPCESPANGRAVCVAGRCEVSCDAGATACGTQCVDTTTSVDHCGACSAVCDAPANGVARCASSVCTFTCAAGYARCGDRCLDLGNDPANCGGCGQTCAIDQVCSSGTCTSQCSGSRVACGGACADTATDVRHCGACDAACPSPANGSATCAGGTCGIACDAGYSSCSGTCVATAGNPAACGSCTNACPTPPGGSATCTAGVCSASCNPGLSLCSGSCVNLQTSTSHCGSCGRACGAGQVCSNGTCTSACGGSAVDCGGSCVDTATDPAHCGGCGLGCTNAHGTTSCTAGACVPVCSAGWKSCDGDPSNGCEKNVSTDPTSCGACGNACPPSASECRGGTCVPRLLVGGAAANHTCVSRPSGAVACWGRNTVGQLGNGTTTDSPLPAAATGIADALQATAHTFDLYAFSCALHAGGTVSCWGSRTQGQIGDGAGTSGSATTRRAVANLTDVVQVSAGSHHACAVRGTGQVACWGERSNGRLGSGSTSGYSDVPVTVAGISNAIQVSAGDEHSCAVLASGAISCWGNRDKGRLGGGNTSGSAATPEPVTGISTAAQVSAGNAHSCAVLRDGTARCWGDRSDDRIGDGGSGSGNQTTPAAVGGLVDAVQISAGRTHSCAVRTTGGVVCWGSRDGGRIGNGGSTAGTEKTPVAVSGMAGAVGVSAGDEHSCAFTASGGVWCWGKNGYGKLGDGTETTRTAPVAVVMLPP